MHCQYRYGMIAPLEIASAVEVPLNAVIHAHHKLDFNISNTAGSYSALAAVLAGFAFNSLILIVTMRLTDRRTIRGFAAPARAILGAFIGLVLTSVSYAVLSGEKGNGRVTAEELFVGIGFVASIMLLLFAIALSLDAAASAPSGEETSVDPLIGKERESDEDFLGSVSDSLRAFVSVALTPLVMVFVYLASTDYQDVRWGHRHPTTCIDWLAYILIVAQCIVGMTSWRRRHHRAALDADRHNSTVRWFTGESLAVITLTTFAFSVSQWRLKPNEMPPTSAIYVALVITFIWLSTATWHFARPAHRSRASNGG